MSDFGERNEAALATSALRHQLQVDIDALQLQYNAVLADKAVAERERDEARAACADVERHRALGERRLTEAERELRLLRPVVATAVAWYRAGGGPGDLLMGEVGGYLVARKAATDV
jgi:hypothetical protein